MFQYHCLNPIAEKGLGLFDEEYKKSEDLQECDAVLVRSAKMHDMELSDNLLAIARAAVADPPVLILDEATSSIDTRTERLVQKGMDALMSGRTSFVIAHRLSTVKDSDQIFVVNDGNIAAHGTHEELLASCPLYEEMWNAHISAKDTVKEEN